MCLSDQLVWSTSQYNLSEGPSQGDLVRAPLSERRSQRDHFRATFLHRPWQTNLSVYSCQRWVMLDWHISFTTGSCNWNGWMNDMEPLELTVGQNESVDESMSRTHCNLLCVTSADVGNLMIIVCTIYLYVVENVGSTFKATRIDALIQHRFPFPNHDVQYKRILQCQLQLATCPKVSNDASSMIVYWLMRARERQLLHVSALQPSWSHQFDVKVVSKWVFASLFGTEIVSSFPDVNKHYVQT